MPFGSLVSAETAAAIVGAAIVTFLVDVAGISAYWLLLMLPLLAVAIAYSFTKHRLQVFSSGVNAYFKEFSVALGRSHWEQARQEFAYWGVTGASIQEELRAFFHGERGNSVKYRFLLMSSRGGAIREQIAFKRGFPPSGRSAEQDASIDAEVNVEQQRFNSTVAVLKSTAASQSTPCRLEIRVYDEFLPWWVYVIDRQQVIVGVLRAGQEVGDQPAAVLTRNARDVTLFECFYENFERVWRSATAV